MIYGDPVCFHFKTKGRCRSTKELARENAFSEATIYNWKSKYGGMESSDVRRFKHLEEENSRLKKIYADVAMDNQILKDLFSKKGWALPQKSS
jgi:putative transposase